MNALVPLVIYHGPVCNDGFASALAAYRYFGAGGCEFKSMNYGKARDEYLSQASEIDSIRGRDIYILDFSFRHEQLQQMNDFCNSVTMLDHHATAKEELEAHLHVSGDCWEYSFRNLYIKFDMNKAGCMLAWDFFQKLKPDYPTRPEFINHLGNYDLWKFTPGDNTDALTTAIGMYPRDFSTWLDFLDSPLAPHAHSPLIHDGKAILKYNDQRMAELCKHTRRFVCLDYTVEIVNAPYFMASRLGNKIVDERSPREIHAACLFQFTDDGKVICSFRSKGEGPNDGVAKQLAENFGGGGHPNAAGCALDVADFLSLIWDVLIPTGKDQG